MRQAHAAHSIIMKQLLQLHECHTAPSMLVSHKVWVCVCADLTSVALMACGVGTLLHVIRFKLPWTPFYYGTGVVSVLGITTTQIVIGLNSINNLLVSMYELTPLFPALAM